MVSRVFLQTGLPSLDLRGRLSRRESEDAYLPRLRSHNRFRQPSQRERGGKSGTLELESVLPVSGTNRTPGTVRAQSHSCCFPLPLLLAWAAQVVPGPDAETANANCENHGEQRTTLDERQALCCNASDESNRRH